MGERRTGDPDALGDQLASWLEELGLADQLGAGGLPDFERDASGRARWRDPGHGGPLAEEALVELDRILRRQGSDPQYAVPLPLLQRARSETRKRELRETAWFTYESLADLRGATVNATRFDVHKAQGAHRILLVSDEGRTLIPAFQLSAEGEMRPEVADVLDPLLSSGMDPWRCWIWLTQPAALLAGLVPEQALGDPGEAGFVLNAAIRLGERVAAS